MRDPSVNGDDFVAAAAALDPRVKKLVSALEQAAGASGDADIEGGCGVGKVHIEAPELFGLAAAIEILRAAVRGGPGYDWAVPIKLLMDFSGQEPAYVDALNAHVLHLQSASVVARALPVALHAVDLFQHGVAAAAGITSRPAHSLFDWTKMPPGTLLRLARRH